MPPKIKLFQRTLFSGRVTSLVVLAESAGGVASLAGSRVRIGTGVKYTTRFRWLRGITTFVTAADKAAGTQS